MGILPIDFRLRPPSKTLPFTCTANPPTRSSRLKFRDLEHCTTVVRKGIIPLPILPLRRPYRPSSLTLTTDLPNAHRIDPLAHPVGPVLLYLRRLRKSPSLVRRRAQITVQHHPKAHLTIFAAAARFQVQSEP